MNRFPHAIVEARSQWDIRFALFRTLEAKKDLPSCVSTALKTMGPFCLSSGPVTFKQCHTLTHACEVCDTYAQQHLDSRGLLAVVASGIMDSDPVIAAKMLWPLLTASEVNNFVYLLQISCFRK